LFSKTQGGVSVQCTRCGTIFGEVPEDGSCKKCGGLVKLVMPIAELLQDHAFYSPADTEWLGNLVISGTKLENYLKSDKRAPKRAITHQAVKDAAETATKIVLKMSKPLDSMPDEFDDKNEDDDDKPEDEEEF
jgi:hypothetical protein